MSTLIIGCGNPDGGDDAAGLLVARKLRSMGFDAREQTGDIFSLVDEWKGADEVVIVDAMFSGAPPGTIRRFDAGYPIPSRQFCGSTHDFGLAEVIELARSFGWLPPNLTVYGIEAASCATGAPVAGEVLDSIEKAVDEIRTLSNAHAGGVGGSSPVSSSLL